MHRRVLGGLCVLFWVVSPCAVSGSGGDIGPGSYCRLPEPGDKPACLEEGEERYSSAFAALEGGSGSDAQFEALEADVEAGSSASQPYVALSSLAYAYYRIAQLAAETPGEDPVVVARLQRWNRLLARAFESSAADADYQSAVLEAAEDLQQRAPTVVLRCVDASGNTTECNSTVALLRGFESASSTVGIRGALETLLKRLVGGDGS